MWSKGGSSLFRTYLNDLVEQKEIPGGVLLVRQSGKELFHHAFGQYDNNVSKVPFTNETIFDLASLTKVVATLPAALRLISLNQLTLADPVRKFLPQFKHRHINIEHLLRHNSGLPADLPYCPRDEKRDVLKAVFSTELTYEPGTKAVYSDLGMIILGKIIEKVSGERLDVFTREEIFRPFGMTDTNYGVSKQDLHRTASTEWFKGTFIHGEVHDEKAFHLHGVSGSAGVFSTAKDLGTYAEYCLHPDRQSIIDPNLFIQSYKRADHQRGLSFQVWDGKEPLLACGSKWPVGSFGHTGFTGTSLWIDPVHEIIVVFLTNVVQYGRKHQLMQIRRQLHTMIHQSLVSR